MKTSIKYIGTFLFGVLASFLGLVVWGDTNGSELTLRSSTSAVDNSLAPTPKPLLPVDDDDLSQNAPITAYAQYSKDSIALTGSVNAQALADAMIVVSNQLIPEGTVTAEFEILTGVDLAIINLEISIGKCTRISFISITYDIFLITFSLTTKIPFHSSWKACTTSAC